MSLKNRLWLLLLCDPRRAQIEGTEEMKDTPEARRRIENGGMDRRNWIWRDCSMLKERYLGRLIGYITS